MPVLSAPAVPAAILIGVGLSGDATRGLAVLCLGGGTALILTALLKGSVRMGPGRRGVACRVGLFRILLGFLLGIGVVGTGLLRVHSPRTQIASSLDREAVVELEARVLEDLRPGSSSWRVLPVEALRVRDQRGWSAAARGRLVVLWQGEEFLPAGNTRLVPVRGDTLVIRNLVGLDTTIWSNDDSIRLIPADGVPRIRRGVRRWILGRLARLDPRGGAMIPALLLGDRAGLSNDLTDAVRVSGASHVLALSGMHLGVLAMILYAGPLRLVRRRYRAVTIVPLLFLYVWIAGWIPSLIRALVLVTTTTVARFRMRSVPMPLLLARTTILVGLVTPRTVGNLGFQLSLLALTGIVLLGPWLLDGLARVLPRFVAGYTGVTLAAMIATAPITLSVFGTVYPAGILLAGVLSFLIVLQMWAGILFLAVASVPIAGTVVARFITWNGTLVHRVADVGYRIPAITASADLAVLVIPGLVVAAALWLVLSSRKRDNGDVAESQLDF